MLVVDDDPQVLAAVRRDLRSRYKDEYTIMGASSGEEAVTTIRDLKARGDSLAIVITDERMPGIQGGEVLTRTLELYLSHAASSYCGLLRQRRGDCDQRSPRPSLPAEAMGPARGSPVSCRGRPP